MRTVDESICPHGSAARHPWWCRAAASAPARLPRRPVGALAACLALAGSPALAEVAVSVAQKLLAADAAAGDEFGFSLSTDGSTLAVGALREDANGEDAGAVYTFRFDATQWVQAQKVLAPDGRAGDQFGQVTVLGDVMAVGARFDDTQFPATGSAYVFRREAGGGAWQFSQLLVPEEAGVGDVCTASDLAPGHLAVPCTRADPDGLQNGGVLYVFATDGTQPWQQQARLTSAFTEPGDRFGGGIFDNAVDGLPRVFVGARGADVAGEDSGVVRVFAQSAADPAAWVERGDVVPGELAAGDEYSARAAIAGDVLAVGAPGADLRAPDAGAVFLFARDAAAPTGWRPLATLTAAGAGAGDNLGRGLAWLDPDTLVAGAPGDAGNGPSAGALYVFRRDECGEGAWGQAARFVPADTAPGDLFGRQVSAAGGVLAASAWSHDAAATDAGAVYLLSVSAPLDSDGDGVLDDRDNCVLAANADQRDSNGDGFGNRCDADLDDSGRTTRSDLQALVARLFTPDADADLDGDGLVTLADLRIARGQLFRVPGPSGVVRCAGGGDPGGTLGPAD